MLKKLSRITRKPQYAALPKHTDAEIDAIERQRDNSRRKHKRAVAILQAKQDRREEQFARRIAELVANGQGYDEELYALGVGV